MKKGVMVTFSEIGLKGVKTREKLIKLLVKNIEEGLKWTGLKPAELFIKWDRIFIFIENDLMEIAKLIKGIPGIRFTAPIYYFENLSLNEFVDEVVREACMGLDKKTFKVETKRRDKSISFTSIEISSMIGKKILEECGRSDLDTKVDLKNPDIKIDVEIDKNYSLFYFQRFEGYDGYPIGSQSSLVSLFSGGTDSAVATWLMMQRGCKAYPIFMNQSPFTGCCSIEKAYQVFFKLRKTILYPEMRLAVAKIGGIMERIVKNVKQKNICLHCKRTMIRVATKYAEKVGAKGLITGESVGQVASQTVDNLYVISQATRMPVFRPLVGFSKEMIHKLAREIDVYELAAKDVGYCDILPSHPITKGKLEEIIEEEKILKLDLRIERVVNNLEFIG
ncbi:MAG: tRNA uracil 4-sulfurtransferase ThiI [Candidatus Bathyarchaeia archaeon]